MLQMADVIIYSTSYTLYGIGGTIVVVEEAPSKVQSSTVLSFMLRYVSVGCCYYVEVCNAAVNETYGSTQSFLYASHSCWFQDMIRNLQLAKQQTWEERERTSAAFEEDRRKNLANKVSMAF